MVHQLRQLLVKPVNGLLVPLGLDLCLFLSHALFFFVQYIYIYFVRRKDSIFRSHFVLLGSICFERHIYT